MKTTPNTLPAAYRDDPRLKPWASIFGALSQSQRAGEVVFNFGGSHHAGEKAALLWLEGEGRFGIIAKAGPYTVNPETIQWFSHGPDGAVEVPDPLQLAADAAMAMRDEIHKQINFWVFTIPVVVFTDMEPDPVIVSRAQRAKVCAVFGSHRLLSDLDTAVNRIEVRRPPLAQHIFNEAQAYKLAIGISDAAQPAAPDPDDPGEFTVEDIGLSARSITININRVDQLIVKPTRGAGPIIQD